MHVYEDKTLLASDHPRLKGRLDSNSGQYLYVCTLMYAVGHIWQYFTWEGGGGGLRNNKHSELFSRYTGQVWKCSEQLI